jgi:hypothetical protein
MKKILIGLGVIVVLVLLTSFAWPQTTPVEEPVECPDAPPALPTTTELDPNPARYAGPACLEGDGDTCVTPPGWHESPGYVLTAEGARITYTNVGQLYTYECPAGSRNAYRFEEDQWVKDLKLCWIRKPVRTSECT